MSQEYLDAEVAKVAEALGKLAPAGGRVTRDQVVFRAGQARGRRHSLKSGALGMALGLCVAFGVSFTIARSFPVSQQFVYLETPVEPAYSRPEQSAELSPADLASRRQALTEYLRLQEELSTRGLEALPAPPEPERDKPRSLEQLLGAS